MNFIYSLLILAALSIAYCRVGYKIAMKESNPVAVLGAAQFIAAIASFPLLVIFFPDHPCNWPLLILTALLWTGFVYFEICSLKHLDLGLAAILGSLEYLIQVMIGIFFFKNVLTPDKLLGIGLMISGIVLSAEWKFPQFRRGFIYQILAVICVVVVFPIDAYLVKQISPWFVSAVAYLGPAVLLFCWRREERKEIKRLIFHSKTIQFAGLANVAGYAITLYVLTVKNFTDTVSSLQLSVCFSLLLGYVVLKERASPIIRLFAGLLIIAGAGFFH